MILYLRNSKNETILDVDLYIKKENDDATDWQHTPKSFIEISSVVPIEVYSRFLLDNLDKKDEIIETFSALDELRGWLWETYFMGMKNDVKEYDNVVKEVTQMLISVAKNFNLNFITD